MADSGITRQIFCLTAAAVSSVFLFSGCDKTPVTPPASKSPQQPADFNARIGWAHGACLSIRNHALKPDTALRIILLKTPQSVVQGKVTGVVRASNECPALTGDRAETNKQDGHAFYIVATETPLRDTMAVAVVAEKVALSQATAEMDLDENGAAEKARSCSTHEGIQFFISTSNKFDNTALWSDYYYLGYDQTPTCP